MQTTPKLCNQGVEAGGSPVAEPTGTRGDDVARDGQATRGPQRGADAAPSDGPTPAPIAPDAGDVRDVAGRFVPGHRPFLRRTPLPKQEAIEARLAAGDLSDVQAALRREAAALTAKLARIADPASARFETLRRRLTAVLDALGADAAPSPRPPAARRKDAPIDPQAGLRAVEAALRDAAAARDEN